MTDMGLKAVGPYPTGSFRAVQMRKRTFTKAAAEVLSERGCSSLMNGTRA